MARSSMWVAIYRTGMGEWDIYDEPAPAWRAAEQVKHLLGLGYEAYSKRLTQAEQRYKLVAA